MFCNWLKKVQFLSDINQFVNENDMYLELWSLDKLMPVSNFTVFVLFNTQKTFIYLSLIFDTIHPKVTAKVNNISFVEVFKWTP